MVKQKAVYSDADVLNCFRQMMKTVKNEYAREYMRQAVSDRMFGHVLQVQVLYVLNNLSGWRGEDARRTKVELGKYVKANW